jgi:hypothetical protein
MTKKRKRGNPNLGKHLFDHRRKDDKFGGKFFKPSIYRKMLEGLKRSNDERRNLKIKIQEEINLILIDKLKEHKLEGKYICVLKENYKRIPS